ncbi:MAG: uracil-DNA glycosylase family protein [bacterium]
MSGLIRQELAALEATVATCERCFGPERRTGVRFQRPGIAEGLLVLIERSPRQVLAGERRLDLTAEDAALRYLGELLNTAEIPRDVVMIAPCLMCRPHARRLEAAVPVVTAVEECSGHVRELLRICRPRLVVSLGRISLRAVRSALAEEAEAADLRFPEAVGRVIEVAGIAILPLYHVTARARLTRPEEQQARDWRNVGQVWRGRAAVPG